MTSANRAANIPTGIRFKTKSVFEASEVSSTRTLIHVPECLRIVKRIHAHESRLPRTQRLITVRGDIHFDAGTPARARSTKGVFEIGETFTTRTCIHLPECLRIIQRVPLHAGLRQHTQRFATGRCNIHGRARTRIIQRAPSRERWRPPAGDFTLRRGRFLDTPAKKRLHTTAASLGISISGTNFGSRSLNAHCALAPRNESSGSGLRFRPPPFGSTNGRP
jgi:hypothetical protein